MDEPYKRPDRAAIAARVQAGLALAAERDGTHSVGPGTGWDPVAAHELATGEPAPLPEPAPPATRCKTCGYLTTSIGHQVRCHG